MIGIIAAMESEVRGTRESMEDTFKIHHGGITFIKGKLYDKEVVVVQSGVGKVNAAMCTQILIDIFKVDILINLGVAGAVHPDLSLGDLVISTDSVQYDMDARAFGHPLGEIPNLGVTFFKADERLIEKAEDAARNLNLSYHKGRVMTADLGVDSPKLKKQLIKEFNGLCVEMEGAAIGQVAMLNHIPYLIIRSISDNADENQLEDYEANLHKSINNGVKLVKKLIEDFAWMQGID